MKFIHLSNKPYTKFNAPPEKLGRLKPKGLWLAPEGVWEEYITVQLDRTLPAYKYEFDIDIDKLIILKTYKDIKNLNDEYGVEFKNKPEYKNVYINWDKIRKETGKSGVYVKNALIKKARNEFLWYYGFDIESISIWNSDAIKSFKLVSGK